MKIEKDKIYSMTEIQKNGFIEGVYNTVLSKVKDDMIGKNILKTLTVGEGKGKKYFIKGINLIKYKNYENS